MVPCKTDIEKALQSAGVTQRSGGLGCPSSAHRQPQAPGAKAEAKSFLHYLSCGLSTTPRLPACTSHMLQLAQPIPGIPALRSLYRWLRANSGCLACTLSSHSETEMKHSVMLSWRETLQSLYTTNQAEASLCPMACRISCSGLEVSDNPC